MNRLGRLLPRRLAPVAGARAHGVHEARVAVDHVGPAVVAVDERLARAAEARPQRGRRGEPVELDLELGVVAERETAAGAPHVVERHRAAAVDERGRADRPGLHQHDRERLERAGRDERERAAQQPPLDGLVDRADRHDVGMRGRRVGDRAREDEPERPGPAVLVVGEALREQPRALPVVDAAEAQQVRTVVETERVAGRGRVPGPGVDTEPDDDRRLRRDREPVLDQSAFRLAPVREPGRRAEQRAVDRKPRASARRARRGAGPRGRRRAGRPATVGWYRNGWNAIDVGVAVPRSRRSGRARPGPACRSTRAARASVTRRPRRIDEVGRGVEVGAPAALRPGSGARVDAVDLGRSRRVVVGPRVRVERARGERVDA